MLKIGRGTYGQYIYCLTWCENFFAPANKKKKRKKVVHEARKGVQQKK